MAAALALGACAPLQGGGADEPGAGPADAAPEATGAPEALAPEVFDIAAAGLWDGRPALGGVWVAHPDVDAPERVRIRAGDAVTDGALFRRERESAGPPFQLSSAAATELGIPPGTPRELHVTALRPLAPAPGDPAPPPETDPATADPAAPDTP